MIAKIHILFEQCLRELRNRSFFSTTDFIQGLLYYNYIQGLAKYSLVWGVFFTTSSPLSGNSRSLWVTCWNSSPAITHFCQGSQTVKANKPVLQALAFSGIILSSLFSWGQKGNNLLFSSHNFKKT